ncbi:MAG: hypothetical protein HOG18_06560 [Proteobacteria bacterium]|jgi:hypothetical protein|nr:hypothetical protein [Pseudomonadota bacterium]MDB4826248.1 hypothetical protein [Gammaproteobacteria bacterium]MBT4107343.1 hypothetical protein [Pseudomonadota bacterium]MBT4358186.1 hypothetical protein [Pseudomonadota bacterium]MBT4986356.1 hypothetical protein [Pseudomonadota bacterium]
MINFRHLFIMLETNLGKALLPVDQNTVTPDRIVTSLASYPNLARQAALEIFKHNGCQKIDDPVTLFPTLDALGWVKQDHQKQGTLDLAGAELLEAIGRHVLVLMNEDQNTKTFGQSPAPSSEFETRY